MPSFAHVMLAVHGVILIILVAVWIELRHLHRQLSACLDAEREEGP